MLGRKRNIMKNELLMGSLDDVILYLMYLALLHLLELFRSYKSSGQLFIYLFVTCSITCLKLEEKVHISFLTPLFVTYFDFVLLKGKRICFLCSGPEWAIQ